MSVLVVRAGARSWRFDPGACVLVGRDAGCDVVVDDPRVSREHLRIQYEDGWVVRDLASTHGTWLAGTRLRRQRVGGPLTIRLADAATLFLDVRSGQSTTDCVRVGRALDNDLVLNDVLASRHHARIERGPGGWQVVDLGSRNRTLVNGTPVESATRLADGDRLTVGATEIHVDGDDFVPASRPRARLIAEDAGYSTSAGPALLSGVDLDLGPGDLLGVVGPPGSGKSTLVKVLTGELAASSGHVRYDDYDVHRQYDAVRGRIGLVPPEDVVHTRLTVRRALLYAARLRLPDDTGAADRRARVDQTLAELGLTDRADVRIDRLSGGQRKRVSIALELLTGPSLLVLDEPTSGLDPRRDRQIMTGLRAIADAGRTVVVVTRNVNNLENCDQLLLLAPGGIPVFTGTPTQLRTRFGTADWDGLIALAADIPVTPPDRRAAVARILPARGRTIARQAGTLVRRHVRLIAASPAYAAFLAVLPIMLAGLALVVPGRLLMSLFVGAAVMGGTASAREIVGERAIFLRERATGLRPVSYVLAKAVVFTVICAVQAGLLVGVVASVRPFPVELGAAVWGVAVASCLAVLLVSVIRPARRRPR